MRDIDTLVAELSRDVPKTPGWQRAPAALAAKLFVVLAIYGAAVQIHLGLRADLRVQFARPCSISKSFCWWRWRWAA